MIKTYQGMKKKHDFVNWHTKLDDLDLDKQQFVGPQR